MAIIDNKFNEKYSLLPDEAKLFLSSDFHGGLIVSLAEEYNIPLDDVYALVFIAVNYDFDLQLLQDRIKSFDLTGINIKRFWIDFLGKLFLPIASYIEKKDDNETKIYQEFSKAGGKIENYKAFFESLDLMIDERNGEELDEFMEKFQSGLDEKEEREYAIDIFSNSIIEMLNWKSPSASAIFNSALIYLLFNAKDFKEQAARIILGNRELIGKKNIVVEGRELAPSIANWIKDFIKINGSDMFSEITLAQYINTSTNAAKLDSLEKNLLSGVLHLYRNISFFPESMKDMLPERWQIFPFIIPEDSLSSKLKKKDEEKVIAPEVEKLVELEKTPEAEKTPAAEKTPEENKFLAEIISLSSVLKNYKPESLEYKAIEEEIRRLKVKK